MNQVSLISRNSKSVIEAQAAEGSHRDNGQCDPEIFKSYLTQKMSLAVKKLSTKEKQLSELIEQLIDEDLKKTRKAQRRSASNENEGASIMGGVKLASLVELNELLALDYLPDDIESNEADAKAELARSAKRKSHSSRHSLNHDLLQQQLSEHYSAYCELSSILEELNQKLFAALFTSSTQLG